MKHFDNVAALIPAQFATDVATRPGGTAWLAVLPDLIGDLLDHWGLRADGAPRHGYLGVVIPVRSATDSRALALKVSQPSTEVDNQILALAAWNGHGTVQLVAADCRRGTLLLERLADQSLDDLELSNAVDTAATLLRRLSVPALVPETANSAAPSTTSPHTPHLNVAALPRLADHVRGWAERWAVEWQELGRALPRRLLDAANEICHQLAPHTADLLVNSDLHYRNILAGAREPWLAIDPRGVRGDPEFALGPLLWNRFNGQDDLAHRFHRFVDIAGLDPDKARGWTIARSVDYFLWSTKAGLTWDPAACREILDWLAKPPTNPTRQT